MTNFFRAFAHALPAGLTGYQQGTDWMDQYHAAQDKSAAASAYGNALRSLFVPKIPGATPMPTDPGLPGAPLTTMPGPAGGPMGPGAGAPPPPSSPSASGAPPSPPGGGMAPPAGPAAPTMPTQPQGPTPPQAPVGPPPMQQGPGQFTLESVVNAVVSANPNATPEQIGMAVDKALPLMNAQAQQQWRQQMMQFNQSKWQDTQDNRDRAFKLNERTFKLNEQRFKANDAYHQARLAQFAKALDRKVNAAAKLDPNIKQQYETMKTFYTQSASNYRTAQTNLQRAVGNYDQDAIAAAQQQLDQAEQAMAEASASYDTFSKQLGGGKAADTSGDIPTDAGDGVTPVGGGAPNIAKPGVMPAPNAPAQIVPLKNGKRAQIGNENTPPKTNVPATLGAEPKQGNPPAVVSAQPSPSKPGVLNPPPAAIGYLMRNPGTANMFDAMYGQGAAARYLKKSGAVVK